MTKETIKRAIKASLLGLAFILTFGYSVQAQKFAYVDVSKILESVPEYNQAQTELDNLASKWRQEIAQEYDKIKSMYNRYQAEQVLLSDESRQQKEEEIMAKEKEVRDLQKAKFGPEGALFQKRKELVQPIQDRVYAAIEDFATSRGFDFIFDKGSATGMIFSNPKFDKTEDIIKKMKH